MKYLLALMIIWPSFLLFGQDTLKNEVIDTTTIHLGKTKIIIYQDEEEEIQDENMKAYDDEDVEVKKKKKKHKNVESMWSGFQIGTNSLTFINDLPENGQFLEQDYSKNRAIAFNIFSHRWDLGIPYAGLSTGLGVAFNRYGLSQNVRMEYDSDGVWAVEDTDHNFDKNLFRTTHITAPLLFELNTNKIAYDGFRVGAGIELGYRIGSSTKIKYKIDGQKQKDRTKGSYNLNPFKLNALAMIGYKDVMIFGKASMTELFIEDKGPTEVYPVEFGLIFNLW